MTIAGLTITDGLSNGDTPNSPGLAGGVLNFGSLSLFNDILSNNQALGATNVNNGFPGGARGGGVHNEGTLTVTDCQFLNNLVRAPTAVRFRRRPCRGWRYRERQECSVRHRHRYSVRRQRGPGRQRRRWQHW